MLSIDTTKANGPDGISGLMLKATANAIFPSVTALFNKSIRSANTTLNDGSDVTLFADDLSLFRAIQSPKDYDKLQEDINELAAWVTTSLLTFNSVS